MSEFDYASILSRHRYIKLLLEYDQIPSYQNWKQNISLMSNDPFEYKYIKGQFWDQFHGLMYSGTSGCLDYNGNSSTTWHYSIGTFNKGYDEHFPGPIFDQVIYFVKFVDFWIEISSFFHSCNINVYDPRYFQNLIFIVILLE